MWPPYTSEAKVRPEVLLFVLTLLWCYNHFLFGTVSYYCTWYKTKLLVLLVHGIRSIGIGMHLHRLQPLEWLSFLFCMIKKKKEACLFLLRDLWVFPASQVAKAETFLPRLLSLFSIRLSSSPSFLLPPSLLAFPPLALFLIPWGGHPGSILYESSSQLLFTLWNTYHQFLRF